ncbi:hypothetical protein ACLOJK_005986 [Asimina triloba]
MATLPFDPTTHSHPDQRPWKLPHAPRVRLITSSVQPISSVYSIFPWQIDLPHPSAFNPPTTVRPSQQHHHAFHTTTMLTIRSQRPSTIHLRPSAGARTKSH